MRLLRGALPTLALASWLTGCVDLSRPSILGGPHDAAPIVEGGAGDGAHDLGAADDAGLDAVLDDAPAETSDGSGADVTDDDSLPGDGPLSVDAPGDLPPPSDATGLGIGQSCSQGNQCSSGMCVDNVCCTSACASPCYSCAVADHLGACMPAPAGTDPRNQCTADPVATCKHDGSCDGFGQCRNYVATTTCLAAACTGTTAKQASLCNGSGACVPGASSSCGTYLCSGTVCGTSCGSNAQCQPGNVCTNVTCGPPPPDAGAPPPDASPDTGPPPGSLVIDDFGDANMTTNLIGGAVTTDNQTVTQTGGAATFVWNGHGSYQDFIEALRADFCEYVATRFTKLRFTMRAATAGKRVAVYFVNGDGNCRGSSLRLLTTLTLTTTMTVYDVDISAVPRDKVEAIELDPADTDNVVYTLDDVMLIP